MFPLIKHYFVAFFTDENTAKRFLAGLGGLVAAAGVTVMAFGTDTVMAWTPKELVKHGMVAIAGAVFAMLPGPKIAKPPGAP